MSASDADKAVGSAGPAGGICPWATLLVPCLFFCASFAYLWLRIDASLLYHSFWAAGSFPVFRLGTPFLRDSVLRPGGLLGYASGFLAQLYYADWSAALTIAAVATLLCMAAAIFLRTGAGARPRVAHVVAGLLFLWPYNRYMNQLTMGLGVLAALTASSAYAALPWRTWWVRFPVFLVLALALYYGGGGFCTLFALLCGLVETVSRRRPVLGAACAACGFVIPWGLGVLAARLFWEEAFVHLWPARREADWVSGRAAVVLYAFCLLLVLAPPALRFLWGRWRLGAIGRLWDSRAGAACGAAALVVIACVVFGRTLDERTRGRMRIDVLAQRERWDDVLREARRLPVAGYSVHTLWDVNRALYGIGRLGDRMFSFPQKSGALLPVEADFFPDTGTLAGSHPMAFAKSSRLLLDLGRVNESEQAGGEALELLGRRPALLRQLFWMNIVKQRTGVALRFLGLLAQDPVHRAWALEMDAQVRRDPLLSQYPEVQRLRAAQGKRQPKAGHASLPEMLKEQLEADPSDRMALEYLMAEYLLTKQLDEFVKWAGRLKGLGVSRLPRHYEEAVLVYERVTGQPVDLGGLEVSEEARQRLFAFESAIARFRGDEQRAKRAAAEHMGTFFFYFTFIRATGS